MVVVESSGEGESSPIASAGEPEYEVYFIPPESALSGADAGIRLAFDVLNFNPQDAASGSLHIEQVEVQRALLER